MTMFQLYWSLIEIFSRGAIPVYTRLFRKGLKATTHRLAASILLPLLYNMLINEAWRYNWVVDTFVGIYLPGF